MLRCCILHKCNWNKIAITALPVVFCNLKFCTQCSLCTVHRLFVLVLWQSQIKLHHYFTVNFKSKGKCEIKGFTRLCKQRHNLGRTNDWLNDAGCINLLLVHTKYSISKVKFLCIRNQRLTITVDILFCWSCSRMVDRTAAEGWDCCFGEILPQYWSNGDKGSISCIFTFTESKAFLINFPAKTSSK